MNILICSQSPLSVSIDAFQLLGTPDLATAEELSNRSMRQTGPAPSRTHSERSKHSGHRLEAGGAGKLHVGMEAVVQLLVKRLSQQLHDLSGGGCYVSGIWHGIYFGHITTFVSGFFLLDLSFRARMSFRPLFQEAPFHPM